MTDSTQHPYYVAHPAVSTRLAGEQGAVIFHADSGREKFLNPTGLFIWERLDGTCSRDEIAAALMAEFTGTGREQVSADMVDFFRDMAADGFVRALTGRTEAPVIRPGEFPDMADGPQSLDLSLTGKCNLHCAYCFYHEEMQSRPDLPTEEWLSFFDELGRLSVRDVCLSGGEVFVRPDLWELIDAVIANRMRYSINTNGTLITEDTLARLDTGLRRQRLSGIQVSIDGSRAEVHDKSRGHGSFDKAVRGLRLLKGAGFPVTVRVTVNRHNVEDLDNTARLLLEDIGIGSFGTNDAMPMGAGCENQKAIVLTPLQQVAAMKSLARLEKEYNGRITASAGPLAKWRMYQEMERARATGEMAVRWKMGYLTACGCMYNKLSVHHDGLITPCNILARQVMGRINRDSLTEIWKTHPVLQALKDRRQIPMTAVPGCEDCEWASYCNGSCPGLACEMTGEVNRANPHDCYRRFLQETGGIEFNELRV